MSATSDPVSNPHDEGFAPVIWAYVEQHRKATEPHTRRKLLEGLKDTLKKWTDVPVTMVSEAALQLATSMGEDLFKLLWVDRLKCGRDAKGRSLLLWEHTTPITGALPELLKCDSPEEVKQWMACYSGVCWITRDEDDRLNRKYRSERPGG